MWDTSVERISDTLALPLTNTNLTGSMHRRRFPMSKTKRAVTELPTIVFVLSLAGRFQTFQRFLANYEQTCLLHPELKTELLVVVFWDKDTDLTPYFIEIRNLKRKYPTAILNHLTLHGNFSRGMALNNATHSAHIKPNDIIFFIDVDITFKRSSIERIRLNTIRNKQVYLPIVFSEYHPHGSTSAFTTPSHAYGPWQFNDAEQTDLDNELGYFRQFGYGICAIFKADIMHPAINGFNTDIAGWGLEDVKFLDQLIKLNVNASQMHKNEMAGRNEARAVKGDPPSDKTPQFASTAATSTPTTTVSVPLISLAIFRAPDPSLVHVYHDINCDKGLSESQYAMCLGTKASTIGSYKYIESVFMNNRKISDFATSNFKIS